MGGEQEARGGGFFRFWFCDGLGLLSGLLLSKRGGGLGEMYGPYHVKVAGVCMYGVIGRSVS